MGKIQNYWNFGKIRRTRSTRTYVRLAAIIESLMSQKMWYIILVIMWCIARWQGFSLVSWLGVILRVPGHLRGPSIVLVGCTQLTAPQELLGGDWRHFELLFCKEHRVWSQIPEKNSPLTHGHSNVCCLLLFSRSSGSCITLSSVQARYTPPHSLLFDKETVFYEFLHFF